MTFWNLKKDADAPQDGVLDIDGEIVAEAGWFTPDGACVAKEFRQALKGIRNVTVHINSPGGDVMAGAEIYSALREHSLNGEGSVTVIVTALAASAASIIAMAGDRILMHPVAYMMIHNPWTIALGDAKELRKAAKTLDVISEGLVTAYQARTGKDRDELKRMLENETWMSAATCVEEGFADGIYGADGAGQIAACARPTMMSMRAHGAQEITDRIREAPKVVLTIRSEDLLRADENAEEILRAMESDGLTISAEQIRLGGQTREEQEEEARKRAEIGRRARIAAEAWQAAGRQC